MNIIQNTSGEIKKIVESKAKYQKVMLLFDDMVSESEILSVHEEIKGQCIFNKCHINLLEKNEIYNGYKMIIYMCEPNSILKINFDKTEFVNVFISIDSGILPYYLNVENNCCNENDYLILNNFTADVCALSSIYFNRFFNYLKDLLNFKFSDISFEFQDAEITSYRILESLNKLNNDMEFIDVKILKETGIDYEDLVLVDFLLISAFQVVISSVENHTLELVDFYKAVKEDYLKVDKFYAKVYNKSLINLIELNFNFLNTACGKTKNKILDLISTFKLDEEKLYSLVEKIKLYASTSDDLIGYLYLYNIFGN